MKKKERFSTTSIHSFPKGPAQPKASDRPACRLGVAFRLCGEHLERQAKQHWPTLFPGRKLPFRMSLKVAKPTLKVSPPFCAGQSAEYGSEKVTTRKLTATRKDSTSKRKNRPTKLELEMHATVLAVLMLC